MESSNVFSLLISRVERNIKSFIEQDKRLPSYVSGDKDKCKDFNMDKVRFSKSCHPNFLKKHKIIPYDFEDENRNIVIVIHPTNLEDDNVEPCVSGLIRNRNENTVGVNDSYYDENILVELRSSGCDDTTVCSTSDDNISCGNMEYGNMEEKVAGDLYCDMV